VDPVDGPGRHHPGHGKEENYRITYCRRQAMTNFKKTFQGKSYALLSAILVIGGMCIFGIFIHADFWWRIISFSGLSLVAIVIGLSVRDIKTLLAVLGIIPFTRKVIYYCIAGSMFGMLL